MSIDIASVFEFFSPNYLSFCLAGFIKDSTGDYDLLFFVAAGGLVINCALNLVIIYLISRRIKIKNVSESEKLIT